MEINKDHQLQTKQHNFFLFVRSFLNNFFNLVIAASDREVATIIGCDKNKLFNAQIRGQAVITHKQEFISVVNYYE